MTKGLRCPNCDTTINRKIVHDWIVNKKASYLQCANQFCNIRWRREVLEKNVHLFIGDLPVRPEPPRTEDPEKGEEVIVTKAAKTPPVPVRAGRNDWLHRVRKIARCHAQKHGTVSIDVLRQWADENSDHPDSPSAWGSVFQTDEWESSGKKNSTYRSNRSRQVTVWRLKSAVLAAVG